MDEKDLATLEITKRLVDVIVEDQKKEHKYKLIRLIAIVFCFCFFYYCYFSAVEKREQALIDRINEIKEERSIEDVGMDN